MSAITKRRITYTVKFTPDDILYLAEVLTERSNDSDAKCMVGYLLAQRPEFLPTQTDKTWVRPFKKKKNDRARALEKSQIYKGGVT